MDPVMIMRTIGAWREVNTAWTAEYPHCLCLLFQHSSAKQRIFAVLEIVSAQLRAAEILSEQEFVPAQLCHVGHSYTILICLALYRRMPLSGTITFNLNYT
jgi:hypothetical protein